MSRETELTFEQAYSRLEELIQRLDAGGLPLDEALTCYEEASALAGRCTELLDNAELRLRSVEDLVVEETVVEYRFSSRAEENEDEQESSGFDSLHVPF
ncbi:MAG: exodeoxyribonuclease VII small subunit [Chloroflexota bacterium]|nr:exodeoxyribonuclease VII small subunit [Chloroflexota bacterium]